MASPFDSAQTSETTPNGDGSPFMALITQDHVAVAQSSADGRFVRINRRMAEVLGYAENELLQLTAHDVTHPDSLQATQESTARLLSGSSHFVLQKKYVRKDGSVFSANTTVSAIRDFTGKLSGFVALIFDISAQQRAQRLVESQNNVLQLIISGAPLREVFSRLIAVVESESEGDALGSVLLLDSATGRLRHGAAPSLPDAYNHTVDGIEIDAEVGTCAAAAASKKVVFTEDIAMAPGWQALKHLPLALGLRAAWSMPIVSAEGEVLGTFGTYFRRSRLPSESEIAMVGMLAKIAAVAIERQQSEEHLRAAIGETHRQQRLYETVLSNTPDLIYVFNLEHRFTYANNALLTMWGRPWDEAIGKNCLELGYEPWHAEMHDREIEQVITTKKSIRGEVAFTGTNGRRFYDYIFVPVLGSGGEVEAIAGTTRDVTEPRKAGAIIRFLSDLTQSLASVTDEREIIRLTVSALGRHLGVHRCYFVECLETENLVKLSENWVRDEAVNLEGAFSLYDFGGVEWWNEYSKGDFAVEDTATNPFTQAKAANYAATGIRSYAVQPSKRTNQWTVVLAVTENHPRKWTDEELRLLENVAARVWPLVERSRAAAALRTARDEALAASQAKDDFLAVLSHELRTPLNPVLLLASEAAENPALPDAVRSDFETIVRNVTLEARLIDDLLDLTRITHNKLPIAVALCDVHSLLHSVMGTVKQELTGKMLSLTTRWEAPTALVMGDEVRLQQVFWNLLKNAAKFTPPHGQLAVATRISPDKADRLEIEFTDTGLGLTADEITKIFDPFAQGEHSSIGSHHYGGLGLGLAISRKIVEMHSGTISAWSPGRGKGATFLVELPLAPAGSQFIARDKDSSKQITQIPFSLSRRILLVEDHAPSRIALARLLAVRKIDVIQASSAAEALEKANGNSIDLVISDIGLPDMNGYDLMKLLQDRHGFRGIALSGYGMEEDIARSRQAGFKAHLTKPVQIQSLDKMLGQFFQQ